MTVGNDPTIHFALDGQNVVQEGHIDNNLFVPDATYLTGPRGVEYRMDESTGTMRYYVYDGLGSVLAEVGDEDANHNPVKCTRKYDVYGAVRAETGNSDSQHKFCGGVGHTTEPDTGGLIYMRARWYDPITGRFVSEDPKEEGPCWYAYCGSNPVNGRDFTGKTTAGETATAGGIAAGLAGGGSSVWSVAANGLARVGQAMSGYVARQFEALGLHVEELGYTMSRGAQNIMWRITNPANGNSITLRLDSLGTHIPEGVHWNIGDAAGNSFPKIMNGCDPHLLLGQFDDVVQVIGGAL